jgi:hypothetical protein
LRKPVGKITEADAPHPVTLKPGDAYTQAVRLDLWPAQANRADSSEPVPNLFTKSGEYVITAHFRHSPRPLATWTADFASPAVRLNVKKEGESDWGEAAGGLRARLRLAKAKFAAGEPLAFELDLKNTGDQTYEDGPIPMFCRIELDGAEYQYTAPLSYPTSIQKIPPGKEFVPYVKVATNEWWTHVFNDKSVPLALAPGTHKVRVGYPVAGKVTPYSPTVEFDVAAGEPTGKEVHGVRARLRPEREKWKAGESPRFALELANEGKRAWAGMPTDQRCVIEVDGAWYENESGLATPRREAEKVLKPGAGWTKWFDVYADRPRDGGVSWVVMLPDDPIRPAPDSQKLKLTPGRHKVRAAYFLTEYGADGRPRKSDAAEIRLETNAVEIEIEK